MSKFDGKTNPLGRDDQQKGQSRGLNEPEDPRGKASSGEQHLDSLQDRAKQQGVSSRESGETHGGYVDG